MTRSTAASRVQLDVLLGIREALAGLREHPAPAGLEARVPGSSREQRPPEVRTRGRGARRAVRRQGRDRRRSKPASPTPRRTGRRPAPRPSNCSPAASSPDFADDAPAACSTTRPCAAPRSAALAALPRRRHPGRDPQGVPEVHRRAEKPTRCRRSRRAPACAKALLDAVEKGTSRGPTCRVVAARQVLALNDKALTARLEKVWGKIRPASKERAALTKKWKGDAHRPTRSRRPTGATAGCCSPSTAPRATRCSARGQTSARN